MGEEPLFSLRTNRHDSTTEAKTHTVNEYEQGRSVFLQGFGLLPKVAQLTVCFGYETCLHVGVERVLELGIRPNPKKERRRLGPAKRKHNMILVLGRGTRYFIHQGRRGGSAVPRSAQMHDHLHFRADERADTSLRSFTLLHLVVKSTNKVY